jgi:hypothetical protein
MSAESRGLSEFGDSDMSPRRTIPRRLAAARDPGYGPVVRLATLGLCPALFSWSFGCSELPAIPEDQCGNLVVEAPEDCDGFASGGAVCRQPGESGACRWDCTGRGSEQNRCPGGFGCDVDGVCRRPSGEQSSVSELVPGDAEALLAGDFDGDGRQDIVALDPALGRGATKIRVHYYDEHAEHARTWTSGRAVVDPVVTELTGDARADLVFTAGDLGVMAGEADSSLLPESYPSYFLSQSKARIIPVSDRTTQDSVTLVVMAERFGSDPGIYRIDPNTLGLVRMIELSRGVEGLAAEPAIGVVFEDQGGVCFDIALSFRGETELAVHSVCELDRARQLPRFRDRAASAVVPLEPPAAISSGLILVDLDGDHHLDLLVGSESGPYAAFGDGASLAPARPFPILPAAADGKPDTRMPLAAGDLTGDGFADYVYPEMLLLSGVIPETGAPAYQSAHPKYGKPWTEALIADLNGNGWLDAAAISRDALDVDFFNGSGNESVNAFTIPTDRPSELLEVGDFDGDLLADLVFVQRNSAADGTDELSVAFGRAAGAPESPRVMARLDGIVQNRPVTSHTQTSASSLFVSYEQPNADGESGTALSLFVGSGDRSLPCPIELSNFAVDGSLETAIAFNVEVGAFSRAGQRDLLAVAKTVETSGQSLWLLPDVSSRRSAARALGWPFGAEIVLPDPEDPFSELEIHLGAGDLDGDGLDELLLAAPAAAGEQCLLMSTAMVGESARVLTRVALDERCGAQADLQLIDLDGDRRPEIVLLTDAPGRRKILVFWAEANGSFGPGEMTELATGEEPLGFTWFRALAESQPALAYVTETALVQRPLLPGLRQFGEPSPARALERGSGIVAADVNGDGVTDLAVADRGAVRIWRSLLE